jgi:hypothetical protein
LARTSKLSDRSSAKSGAKPGTLYAYKASLVGAAQQFELRDNGMSWRIAGKSGVWPYAAIASVRLSYRPVSMQQQRFRADLEDSAGSRIHLISTTWQTVALMAPQDADYRAFMIALHRRMHEAGSHAVLIGGLKPWVYVVALATIALLALAMAGLLARAVATAQWGGALFIIGFTALFAWQIGGFIRRNRPRNYTFEDLPKELLP